MKTVVIPNDGMVPGNVNDALYEQYVRLLGIDIKDLLLKSPLVNVSCPGCQRQENHAFADCMGMTYYQCRDCESWYVAFRPMQAELGNFYKDSKACQFWRQEMASLPDERLYYIYGPRVAWMIEWADEYLPSNPSWVDIHTKYAFLIKHMQAQNVFGKIVMLDPQLYENIKALPENIDTISANTRAQVDMVTCFEGLERAADPKAVVHMAHTQLKSGGLFFLTTASCSGFEYQVLKAHAPNLNPINRMNLLSLEAIVTLLEQANFEVLELSTPGRLDVDIVKNTLAKNDLAEVDPFWKYVFFNRHGRTSNALQQFLQESRLSSHVRMVARKK